MQGDQNNTSPTRVYFAVGKRLTDIVIAAMLLVALLLPLALIALIIRLRMGQPILFRQTRLGRFEKQFEMLKFRTVGNDRDSHGKLLPKDQRITSLGRLLRRASLDELPQLWNVLRGDMSLVGPRPLYPHYLPYYTIHERRRHDVRPGMTGLAQVRGRKHLDWDQRLCLDVQYVEQLSLALDLHIFAATIGVVLSTRGSEVGQSSSQSTLSEHRDVVINDSPERQDAENRRLTAD